MFTILNFPCINLLKIKQKVFCYIKRYRNSMQEYAQTFPVEDEELIKKHKQVAQHLLKENKHKSIESGYQAD